MRSVVMEGGLQRLTVLLLLILGSACSGDSSAPISVATVTIDPASATIAPGATSQFSAITRDASGNLLTGRTITWSSSNSSVASVSTTGLAAGVTPGGPVTITATSEGKSGSAQVTVQAPVATITIEPATVSLTPGGTAQLTPILKDASGNVLAGRIITWSSSNSTVAAVSTTGLVTGAAPGGPVTITATSEGRTGAAQVTVQAPVASVTIVPAAVSIAPGETAQLTPTLKDASGNTLTGRSIVWSTSNPAVAAVSPTGLVTGGTSGGPVTVTATSEGKSGSAQVTVQSPITSVTITGALRVKVGDSYTYTATARTSDGTVVSRPVIWSVGDPSSATMTSAGALVPLKPVVITIRATIDGVVWQGTTSAYDWVTFGSYPTLGIYLDADVAITNRYGTSEYPSLVIGCVSGNMVIYVSTDYFITANGHVTYLFDSDPIVSETWLESSGFDSLIYPGTSNSINVTFANRIAAARIFGFAFTEFLDGAHATLFRVTGFAPKLATLISACQLTGPSAVTVTENERLDAVTNAAKALNAAAGRNRIASANAALQAASVPQALTLPELRLVGSVPAHQQAVRR